MFRKTTNSTTFSGRITALKNHTNTLFVLWLPTAVNLQALLEVLTTLFRNVPPPRIAAYFFGSNFDFRTDLKDAAVSEQMLRKSLVRQGTP
jgi:hypothetical protein